MKNESIGFNIPSSNQEDMINFDKNSEFDIQPKNNEIFPNNFDADLNLSNIINYETNEIKETKVENNKKTDNILNTEKSFEESFENFSKINIQNDNINLEESEIQSEILTNENNEFNDDKKKSKKKRTKDDLNNTPLPVFECLYCTNEKIVFQHFINEILSDKYLLQTSIYDMNDLNKIIINKRLINNNKDEKLFNLIIKSTEYIKVYNSKKEIDSYFKSDNFNNLCLKTKTDANKFFKNKIEDSIVRKKKDFYFKGINKIPKNSLNNKGLFNSTNSLINNFNALSGLVEPVQTTNNANNNIKNNYTIGTYSNNSINFNSLSLNNNEFNCYCKDNNNMLDYIVEKIEKNEESVNYVDDKDLIIDFFKFDLSRKINNKDIKWENKIYDIWNPEIDSDFDENEYIDENDDNINKISNDTKNRSINMNINNINNKFLGLNKNISNKSMGYIKYQKNKGKNLIFTFNKKKDKSKTNKKNNNNNNNQENEINKSNKLNNNNISNENTFNSNSNIIINSMNDKNQSNITKDVKEKNYPNSNITNKSISINNIIINKSQDVNKKIPKQKNQTSKNSIINNRKNLISGISFLRSFNNLTNSNFNINKSANILGKSKKKINYSIQNINRKSKSKSKNKSNVNIKSLQYMSNSKNSNASTNYSIGISINLKSNSSIKSNGFLQCLNYENSLGNGIRIFDENKSINCIKINETKKSNKNSIKKNKLFNLFNNLNLVNFKQKYQRAKSNYKINIPKNEKKNSKSSKSINVYKNKNKKNDYNIYQKNNLNKQKDFNFSSERKNKVIIARGAGHLISSNTKQANINDNLYSNSLGISIGSNDNNFSENNTHIQFNSISNINKSSSNMNNSNVYSNNKNNNKHLFSPNKFNKTYYSKGNNKEIKRKLNDLIFMVNYNKNKNYDINHKNNISNFKNKSINLVNSKPHLKKQSYKSSKRFIFK